MTWRATLAVVAALVPQTVQAQPYVTARAAIIVDAESGAVIWEHNPDQPLPPASTTKVMTAVLALQSHRLDQQFPVSANASATPPSKIGLRPGQSVALRDLLYAVLLKSANDAAVVVAEGVSGSEFTFADRMNLKARVVGATTTNFVNPHGLTESGHVSTARDLSRIFRYGLGIPGFREVLRTSAAAVEIDGPNGRLAMVRSHNRLLNAPDYQVIGKTGYTRLARRCFVGAAGWGSREVVIAILGSNDLWGDARRMLYYGLSPGTPTPVLMASATPPPPPAVAQAAPPPPPPAAVVEPEPAVARAAVPAAPAPAVERAARMARALPRDEPAFEEDEGRTGEPEPAAREIVSPPVLDDEPSHRPAEEARREYAAPAMADQPVGGAAADPEPTAANAVDHGADVAPPPRPSVATEPSRPAAAFDGAPRPASAREVVPGAPDVRDERDEPGAAADHEPAPTVWADSPVRDARDDRRRMEEEPAAREARRETPEPRRLDDREAVPATRVAERPARPATRTATARKPTSLAATSRTDATRPGRGETRTARSAARGASGRDDKSGRAVSQRERQASQEPVRPTARDARRQTAEPRRSPETSRAGRADKRHDATPRAERGRRQAVVTRASLQEPPPTRPSARGTEVERGRTAKSGRDARRRASDDDEASGSRGKYTVQVGPFRDRKAVDSARAGLAKKGYEARVVGQKLELGNFAERSRADKLASRLRVNGHRATSAAR